MTTASDIILSALKFINVYAPGESLDDADAQDALTTLNDLLESFSTTQFAVYSSNENIFTFTPGQYEYTVGNYDAGQFPGTVTSGSPVITGATVPSNMVAGGDLTGTGIPAGTTIVSFNAGANTVTMSQNGDASPGAQQISYTIPGDFKMPRPLRVQDSFTRISSLDYPIESITQDRYTSIGFKSISAPWPIVMWYNPTYPLGTLFFYQNPSTAGELHFFSDHILSTLAELTTDVILPQGYGRWLKRALGRELAPEYGAIWTPHMERLWKEAQDNVKALNAIPIPVASYDASLTQSRRTDAGWIMHGGFR